MEYMQIIQKRKNEKLFCNTYEKLNLSEYLIYSFLPQSGKIGH